MICMAGNHLLENTNLSDPVLKNINALAPRPSISYFWNKRDDKIGYMVMNLLINSIKKGAGIFLIYQILSSSTINDHFLNSYFTQ